MSRRVEVGRSRFVVQLDGESNVTLEEVLGSPRSAVDGLAVSFMSSSGLILTPCNPALLEFPFGAVSCSTRKLFPGRGPTKFAPSFARFEIELILFSLRRFNLGEMPFKAPKEENRESWYSFSGSIGVRADAESGWAGEMEGSRDSSSSVP